MLETRTSGSRFKWKLFDLKLMCIIQLYSVALIWSIGLCAIVWLCVIYIGILAPPLCVLWFVSSCVTN
jgi:nitrate reductase NapE component